MKDKIKDLFLFRESSELDNHSTKPVVTIGSIVWGLVLRSSLVIFLSLIIIPYYELYEYWWWALVALWFFAVWPSLRQWQTFSKRMEDFEESTLCGTCKFFDSSGQFCKIYDQHVSKDFIPCEGNSWEPK